jgi:DNA-binding MurR/RpiR family transcriptional regulator
MGFKVFDKLNFFQCNKNSQKSRLNFQKKVIMSNPAMERIRQLYDSLTPKGRILGDFILHHPRKAVFMTTKEMAAAVEVSEATVVRFVSQLGYGAYSEFLQALREYVDAELTLLDRADRPEMKGRQADRLRRVVFEEMDNLKHYYEQADMEGLTQLANLLEESARIFVVGSRLSYTLAYYLGWSLTKIRSGVQIIKGSDSTAIDWLTIAPPDSLVVVIATTRYPNELIKLGKVVRRKGQILAVIADSRLCPLIPFAHHAIVAPTRHIPFIGSITIMGSIVNYLVQDLAARNGGKVPRPQEQLEQAYRENDILFNLDHQELGKV